MPQHTTHIHADGVNRLVAIAGQFINVDFSLLAPVSPCHRKRRQELYLIRMPVDCGLKQYVLGRIGFVQAERVHH